MRPASGCSMPLTARRSRQHPTHPWRPTEWPKHRSSPSARLSASAGGAGRCLSRHRDGPRGRLPWPPRRAAGNAPSAHSSQAVLRHSAHRADRAPRTIWRLMPPSPSPVRATSW
jgi:hypothetical protein